MRLDWENKRIRRFASQSLGKLVLNSDFILGQSVSRFEEEFAFFQNSNFCVGVGNGTDALELALRVLDIEPEGEVIVPANSFVASAIAVIRAGLKPKFADCDVDFYHLTVASVEAARTANTRAIMPVHLYGQLADVANLKDSFHQHSYFFVEDAAQSHGAVLSENMAGGLGDIAAFSFYPAKNLGAFGDGGAVTTNSPELYASLCAMRNYGAVEKYHHPTFGVNSRLDAFQGEILRRKLKTLREMNLRREKAALYYLSNLGELEGLGLPRIRLSSKHAWHLFVVRVQNRDTIRTRLSKLGVETGVHYPRPLHFHGAFKSLGYAPGDFPIAERLASEVLSLPLHPGITRDEQDYVIEKLSTVLR